MGQRRQYLHLGRYINSRVAKYDRNGDWVMSWGEKGTGPGQFRLPHSIAIDRNNNVYVGDRTNRRIQVFTTGGKFLRSMTIDVPPAPARAQRTAIHLPASVSPSSSVRRMPYVSRGREQILFVGELTFPRTHLQDDTGRQSAWSYRALGRQLKQFSGGISSRARPKTKSILQRLQTGACRS
jgi:hypothetical protein